MAASLNGMNEEFKMKIDLSNTPIWNVKDIPVPPICTIPHSLKDIDTDKVRSALSAVRDAVVHLQSEAGLKALTSEYAILAKLRYKAGLQLKREKLLKGMKKIEKCIERLKNLDILQILKNIADDMPSESDLESENPLSYVYLPSRMRLVYCLVKMLGCCHLVHQIINYCIEDFKQMMQQMRLGMYIHQMLVYMATISRIWVVCRSVKQHMVVWYKALHHLEEQLTGPSPTWLNESLPEEVGLGPEPGLERVLMMEDTEGVEEQDVLKIFQPSSDLVPGLDHSILDISEVSEDQSMHHGSVQNVKQSIDIGEAVTRKRKVDGDIGIAVSTKKQKKGLKDKHTFPEGDADQIVSKQKLKKKKGQRNSDKQGDFTQSKTLKKNNTSADLEDSSAKLKAKKKKTEECTDSASEIMDVNDNRMSDTLVSYGHSISRLSDSIHLDQDLRDILMDVVGESPIPNDDSSQKMKKTDMLLTSTPIPGRQTSNDRVGQETEKTSTPFIGSHAVPLLEGSTVENVKPTQDVAKPLPENMPSREQVVKCRKLSMLLLWAKNLKKEIKEDKLPTNKKHKKYLGDINLTCKKLKDLKARKQLEGSMKKDLLKEGKETLLKSYDLINGISKKKISKKTEGIEPNFDNDKSKKQFISQQTQQMSNIKSNGSGVKKRKNRKNKKMPNEAEGRQKSPGSTVSPSKTRFNIPTVKNSKQVNVKLVNNKSSTGNGKEKLGNKMMTLSKSNQRKRLLKRKRGGHEIIKIGIKNEQDYIF